MVCDPKKIFTDLNVIGAVLTYAELWVSGDAKTQVVASMSVPIPSTILSIYTFNYKNIQYYNAFKADSNNKITEATIRTGTYNSGNATSVEANLPGDIVEARKF